MCCAQQSARDSSSTAAATPTPLHHQFGVRMRGVFDVQVAFCLKKDKDHGGKRGAYLMGLRKALKECPGLDDEARHELDRVKSAGASLFAPELGGSVRRLTKRPMYPDLIKYAAADVTYLHHMHRAWRVFVGEKKMAAVTERRMRERIESPEGLEQGRRRRNDGGPGERSSSDVSKEVKTSRKGRFS